MVCEVRVGGGIVDNGKSRMGNRGGINRSVFGVYVIRFRINWFRPSAAVFAPLLFRLVGGSVFSVGVVSRGRGRRLLLLEQQRGVKVPIVRDRVMVSQGMVS